MGNPSPGYRRRRRRRRIDLAVGLAIAVVAGVTGVILWRTSAASATHLATTPADRVPATPAIATAIPDALHQIWTLTTDPGLGAVVSPYGAVVTTSEHVVTGHDLTTGAPLWSYDRSNVPLCGAGSAATAPAGAAGYGANGIVTVFATNGWCSQVIVLDPTTGARLSSRTSPNRRPGTLVFGGSYTAWVSADLLEVWRSDFVRVAQYGDQPNPVDSDGPHLGCTFGDAALADQRLATIEHCSAQPGVARLVLNYADLDPDDNPTAKSRRWDPMHFPPLATVDTGSRQAVIVGVTPDRAAVLVAQPRPAVVVYDSAGTEISRTPVDVPAAQISATAAAGVTPSVTIDGVRYTLVGDHLLSVSGESVQAPAPPVTEQSSHPTTSSPGSSALVTVQSPHLDWVTSGAWGLPARVGGTVLMPTASGLAELRAADGDELGSLAVDRGSYRGRVDVTMVGLTIVEVRGGSVVGLAGS